MRSERRLAPIAWLLGLGLAVVLALGAVAVRWWGLPMMSEPGAALPAAGTAASDKSLGVNADLGAYDQEAMVVALQAMDQAGFRWLRLRFPWDAIEPEQGVYDWATWDVIVERAGQQGLQILAVLDGSPEWARAGGDDGNPLAPPLEARHFGQFAAALAGRYHDEIDHYQVWQEPNIAPHWGEGEINPGEYAELLREGAIQIRSSDPGAMILSAALAPNVEPGGENMDDLLFLDSLYREDAAEWFDGLAVQLYDLDGPLEAPADPGQLNWNRARLLRQVMERNGDGGTPVWAVSAGLGTGAERAGEAIEYVRRGWPWLGPVIWAAWAPADTMGQHALIDEQGQPRPALGALSTLARAPTVAWPGAYPADHGSGSYEGDWRVTPFGADIGQSGDRLTIPFWGSDLDLGVRRGPYRAFLFVSVDGQPANALPRDLEGRAYVVLYDPLGEQATVALARGLPEGEHEVEIEAERGWGQWAITSWTVARGARSLLDWCGWSALLGFASIVTLGVVLWRALSPGNGSGLMAWHSTGLLKAFDERLMLVLTAAAVLLLWAVPGTVLTLLTLGLVAGLLLLRPETGLPLIAVTLPFYQPGKPLLGKVFSMVEILTWLTAAGWAASWLLSVLFPREGNSAVTDSSRPGTGGTGLSALDWGVLALVLVGLASLLWAEQLKVAAREFRTVLVGAGIYYGLLRTMVQGRSSVWRLADAWVLGGVLVALVGLGQWALGQNLISAEGVSRTRAFYGSPNNLALYLGRVLPLGVAMGVWLTRQPRKWAYGLAAVLMVAALVLTFSRGAWLVGVPVSLLFVAGLRSRRSLVVAAGLLLAAALVVLLLVGPGRLPLLLDREEGTTFFRLQLWRSSWAMIRDHPVLGVGLDNFLYQYRTRYVLPTAWEEFNLSHPHNLVFDSWLRLGLPGLAVFLWLYLAFFWDGWRAYRRLREGAERLLTLGLMGGMVYTVAHGLVDNAFFLVDLAYVFALMLALVQVTLAHANTQGAVAANAVPLAS